MVTVAPTVKVFAEAVVTVAVVPVSVILLTVAAVGTVPVVTTTIPYKPIVPWMDGCVPDSSRYVPGRGAVQVRAVVAPAATSVENDCTRGPCVGGEKAGPLPTTGHVAVLEDRLE
jgi:hypothetical protein